MAAMDEKDMIFTNEVLHRDSPYIVFSDFDGTITELDTNDHLTDVLGFGKEKRKEVMGGIATEEIHFRDGFRQMLESIPERNHTFDDCKEVVRRDVKLDPGFKDFFEWSKQAKVPVVIVSSGMVQVIRTVLENLLEPEDTSRMEIIANQAIIQPDGKFEIKFRHPESGFGHDKSKALRIYRDLSPRPTIFFCGDGVSDMSAAREADVLFVRCPGGVKGDLARYCDKYEIDYLAFSSFVEVRDHVRSVVEGKQTVADLVAKGRALAGRQ